MDPHRVEWRDGEQVDIHLEFPTFAQKDEMARKAFELVPCLPQLSAGLVQVYPKKPPRIHTWLHPIRMDSDGKPLRPEKSVQNKTNE